MSYGGKMTGRVLLALALAVSVWMLLRGPRGESTISAAEPGLNAGALTKRAGGARLRGRSDRSTGHRANAATETPQKTARIEGTVVVDSEEGLIPVADIPVVVSFEAYRRKMGFSMRWIIHRQTVLTDRDGGYGLPVPESDYLTSTAYVTVEAQEGWLTPPRVKLSGGLVFVALEIPTRIYHHSKWVSLPAPDGSAWPRDKSGRWARPTLRLERAVGVEGIALDPWGKRLPNVLVGCSWPLRDIGLQREVVLTDSMGLFAFEVPAAVPEVELDLKLRPNSGEVSRLAPLAKARKSPYAAEPPSAAEEAPKPSADRHPWPGIPRLVVRPGARGVVLQARESAQLSGRVLTTDGRLLTEGVFDVQPGPDCPWPLGYDNDYERRIKVSFEPDGRFVLYGLPAGQWVLVYREEREDKPPLLGHVFIEAPSEDVELVCRPAVKLELEFVARPGDPPLDPQSRVCREFLQPAARSAGTCWWSDPQSPLLMRFREEQDSTRRSGRPGTRTDVWLDDTPGVLHAKSGDGRQALVERLDPAAGLQLVVLVPGGVIEGVVADYDQLGFMERSVQEYTPAIWVVARRGHLVRKGRMTRAGKFRIDELPPGPWVVSLCGEHIHAQNPRARCADVSTGTRDVVLHAR